MTEPRTPSRTRRTAIGAIVIGALLLVGSTVHCGGQNLGEPALTVAAAELPPRAENLFVELREHEDDKLDQAGFDLLAAAEDKPWSSLPVAEFDAAYQHDQLATTLARVKLLCSGRPFVDDCAPGDRDCSPIPVAHTLRRALLALVTRALHDEPGTGEQLACLLERSDQLAASAQRPSSLAIAYALLEQQAKVATNLLRAGKGDDGLRQRLATTHVRAADGGRVLRRSLLQRRVTLAASLEGKGDQPAPWYVRYTADGPRTARRMDATLTPWISYFESGAESDAPPAPPDRGLLDWLGNAGGGWFEQGPADLVSAEAVRDHGRDAARALESARRAGAAGAPRGER